MHYNDNHLPQMNTNKLVLSSRMHFKSALTFAYVNALYVRGNEYLDVLYECVRKLYV